jgi:nitrous oxidase accessory protein
LIFQTILTALLLAPGNDASSLQERINSADIGDTIQVEAGHHFGNLTISKRLHLIGEPGATIYGGGVESAITILSDSVELAGFAIEHSGTNLATDDAGIMIRADHCIIHHNALQDILFGIYFYQADSNSIHDNTITGRSGLESGERGSGMHLFDSHYNDIHRNIVTGARDGFYVQNSSHTTFESNEVSRVRYGLHYMYSDSNQFFDNRFTHNVAGAAVMYSNGITIRRNQFLHNRGFASYGILFQDCHGLIFDSNLVADNVIGLFFEATTNSSFQYNIIAGNDIAIQMFQNSPGNLIASNNFIENLNPLVIVGKRTGTLWSSDGRGNYWSSYNGYDLDDNGTGDIPMKIHNVFEYLEGRLPMVRLYLYSPASQALAVATEAFPILALNDEQDEHPLMRPVELRDITDSAHPGNPDLVSNSSLMILLIGAFAGGGIWTIFRRGRI